MVSSRMQPPVLLWRLINLLLVLARLLAINWFLKRRVQGGKQAEGIGEARQTACGSVSVTFHPSAQDLKHRFEVFEEKLSVQHLESWRACGPVFWSALFARPCEAIHSEHMLDTTSMRERLEVTTSG